MGTMSAEYTCGSVRFIGDKLGSSESKNRRISPRWTEVNVYKTEGGTYVGHIIGRSTLQGEVDIHTVHVASHAKELVMKMKLKNRIPQPSFEALDQASGADPSIDEALSDAEGPTFIK